MAKKFEIIFQPDGKRIKVEENTTILDASKEAGIDLVSICGGKGICGKCKVIIEKGELKQQLDDTELKFISEHEIDENYRLACRVKIRDNLIVRIPEESRTGKQRLQVEGIKTKVKLDPVIKKYYIKLEKPTLIDQTSDFDRIKQALKSKFDILNLRINLNLLKNLGELIRSYNWNFTVCIWDNEEIISIEEGDTTNKIYGYATDIGTTKLAGYLLDLHTGEVLAVGSLMNPQIPFGEDVISRIGHKEPNKLQSAVIDGLNKIFEEICEKANINPQHVYELVAVGNTSMHHLFLGIKAKQIGVSPYIPVISRGISVQNEYLKIKMNEFGRIYTLPVISGYVGADTMGVLLSTEIYKKDEICMALDIGTNTEVILGNKDRILTTSCASGPAFEGAHIQFGMRASSGAIEKIKIDPKTLDPEIETIDHVKPRGICGSAIVDIPAEMLKSKIIDVKGKMNYNLDSPRLRKGEKYYEYVLVWGKNSAFNKDIVITQKDIREISLAKAAIHTGTTILLQEFGINESDIDKLFIAGAFGTHINIENARFIGMFPEIPTSKIKTVGNAAGTGARMCLVSKEMRNIIEKISKKVEYIELGAHPDFQKVYLNSNYLPYADLSFYPETSNFLKQVGNFPEKKLHIF
ncbi:MAG: ASKHA domain-containing protein [Candidatus Helarchaeota archaeon]